jgi:DNA-binding transcriptional regulator YdaS (Cro superfamily)
MAAIMPSLSMASMLLNDHLKTTGATHADFAQLVRVSEPAVQHWVSGYARPRRKVRLLIESITGIAPSSWEEPSDPEELARFIAGCELRERRRHEQHEARMAVWRAVLDRRQSGASEPPP